MENRTMNKTVKYITMATIGLTFMFGDTGELTNVPNKVYPNKKPLISKTPTAVSVTSSDARHLKVSDVKHLKKVRNRNANSWPASHVHNGCHTKKVKAVSSVTNRPQRFRRSINKKGR